MKQITAGNTHFSVLNDQIRKSDDADITISECLGQRYIASGLAGRHITIKGTPGNALGAYLDGSNIEVYGNAQDATGDTMNGGAIVIHGNAGDATGYAMRGGAIYVRGNAGYRTGIHMKAYKEAQPVIVVGGKAGSFLGEYQAGGVIIVLGLESAKETITPQTPVPPRALTGAFCGTGMHGGAIYLRGTTPSRLPAQVVATEVKGSDIDAIKPYLNSFCRYFTDIKPADIFDSMFCVLTPNTKNPYTQLYTHN
jgi:glutamate synthase domain-containing protein 3